MKINNIVVPPHLKENVLIIFFFISNLLLKSGMELYLIILLSPQHVRIKCTTLIMNTNSSRPCNEGFELTIKSPNFGYWHNFRHPFILTYFALDINLSIAILFRFSPIIFAYYSEK